MLYLKDSSNMFGVGSALFIDRDGVINVRIPDDYVASVKEFEFLPGVVESIAILSKVFDHIFVVTNQQGVGKGLMSMADVDCIHEYMCKKITEEGGRIDRVYVCPDLKSENTIYRKPGVGMGLQARKEFPQIVFSKSFMLGDTRSDMEFGHRLGMHTVLIGRDKKALDRPCVVDKRFDALCDFASYITSL